MRDHPFFKCLELAEWGFKKTNRFGVQKAPRAEFYRMLKNAHPIVFDRRVTFEKRTEGRGSFDLDNLVEEFSLPFKTSLYLLTDAPHVQGPANGTDGREMIITTQVHGYLIEELEPELFASFAVATVTTAEGAEIPSIYSMPIGLAEIQKGYWKEFKDEDERMHNVKEIGAIMELTNAISVKRVGIERNKSFSLKTKGIGTGYTSIKAPNLYHIADKEEYEYTTGMDGEINWDRSGWVRGHWRAFYVYDGDKKIKDQFGRNVVDYNRVGKNRAGEYNVAGYTWVIDHIVGDPDLAEIKTHWVVKK